MANFYGTHFVCNSIAMAFCFIVFQGMVFALLGPTLLDLQHVSQSTTEQIAFVITGRSVGILLGCLLASQCFFLMFTCLLKVIVEVSSDLDYELIKRYQPA